MICPACNDTGLATGAVIGGRYARVICGCEAGDRVAAFLVTASARPPGPPHRTSEPHKVIPPEKAREEARDQLAWAARNFSSLKHVGNALATFRAEQQLHAAAFRFVRDTVQDFNGAPGPTDTEFAAALDAYVAAPESARRATREAVFNLWAHRYGPTPPPTCAVTPSWEGRLCPHCGCAGFKAAVFKAMTSAPNALLFCDECGCPPPDRPPTEQDEILFVRGPHGGYVTAPRRADPGRPS